MNLSLAPQRRGSIPLTKKQQFTADKKESNAYSREFAPSPIFSFSCSELTTTTQELYDFFQDKPAMEKYGVMTNLVIQNSSSQEVKIYLNQSTDRVITIPAGVVRSLDQEEIQGGVTSLIAKNNGSGTITAGQLVIETFKKGEQIDRAFGKLHKKLFKIGGF